MSAGLATVAIFAALAIVYAWLPPRWRPTFLLIVSVLAIYALQPFSNLRFAAYSLQTLTILLTLATWWLTQRLVADAPPLARQDRLALLLLLGLMLLVTSDRLLPVSVRLLPYRPPQAGWVLLILAGTAVLSLLLAHRHAPPAVPPRAHRGDAEFGCYLCAAEMAASGNGRCHPLAQSNR